MVGKLKLNMKTKICSKCNYEKSITDFYKHKSMDDGLQSVCKDCIKQYSTENEKRIKKYQQEYRDIHKGKFIEYKKEWYQNNKEIIKQKRINYRKNKYASDIKYRLTTLLRSRLWHALKGLSKSKRTLQLLDCSVDFLKEHLEKQFKPGMTWENYGKDGWEVDHIKPCASFDLSKSENQEKCFHYSNLQPLWYIENKIKRAKV